MKRQISYVVYKITNLINNKIYIGQDKYNRPLYYGSGVKIKLAIKKYGKENFRKEILEYCGEDHQLVGIREVYWIKTHNARDPNIGYNLAEGGLHFAGPPRIPGTYKHSPEAMLRVKKAAKERRGVTPWNKGATYDESFKVNFHKPKSEKHKQALRGRVRTAEHCLHLSESKRSKHLKAKHRRAVRQLSLDGILIKEFDCITDAALELNCKISDIARCCKGINKTVKKFKWEYKTIIQ